MTKLPFLPNRCYKQANGWLSLWLSQESLFWSGYHERFNLYFFPIKHLIDLKKIKKIINFFFFSFFAGRRVVEVGGEVTGTIDNRFEHGYLVSVEMGSEKLSGFLYHIPSEASVGSHGSHNNNMYQYQLALREASPDLEAVDTSGYDVFFTEHYVRLKPLYHGQENVIRKRIQVLWNTLTEEEKQVKIKKLSTFFVIIVIFLFVIESNLCGCLGLSRNGVEGKGKIDDLRA